LLLSVYVGMFRVRETTKATDTFIVGLISVLFITNMIGLISRNPMPFSIRLLQGASFSAFLLAFYVASNLRLSAERIRKLLIVLSVFIIYNFVVSLNQHYGVLQIKTPILGISSEDFSFTQNAYGTLGSASGNGQFAMMMFAFLIPLLCASVTRYKLRLNPVYFTAIALICVFTVILSNMRAAAIESLILTIIYSIMFTFMYRRSFRNSKYLNIFSITAVFFLMAFGVLVGLDNMARDFAAAEIGGLEGIISGEGLNRGSLWVDTFAWLGRGSWWVGVGHGVFESNQIAIGGKRLLTGGFVGGGHLHNLYLMLPVLYGWFGAIAYLLLFFSTVFRLLNSVKRFSFDRLAVVTCLSFLVSLIFFLLDEYKSGNAVQSINYPMIAWIWLGLALAAVRTLRLELVGESVRRNSRKNRSVQTLGAQA